MPSKTSCFNRSIFWKSVSRFWPVWGAYLAIWIVIVPVVLLEIFGNSAYQEAGRLQYTVSETLMRSGFYGGVAMSAVFGVFSAMAVWSFLYSPRSAHATACLPVRREGVFLSVTLAGLLPYLAANLIVALLALLTETLGGVPDLSATAQLFALSSLPFILFYGFAVFCAQLTGNILVLPAVYAVLNFVFVGAEVIVRSLLSLFVFGMASNRFVASLKWLSPVVGILMKCDVRQSVEWGEAGFIRGSCTFKGWTVYLVYAAVGLVFLVLALLLYRRRRMETAGDVVAVEALKPVFRWCMAIGCALLMAALYILIFAQTRVVTERSPFGLFLTVLVLMLIAALIGWFIAEMLIRKSFRVFRGRWAGLGICCLVIAALMFAMEFDLFGYEKNVPDPDSVASVSLICNGTDCALEQPESIALAARVHESIVSHKAQYEEAYRGRSWDESASVVLTYTLRSGRQVCRDYYLEKDPSAQEAYDRDITLIQEALNCTEAVADRKETRIPVTEQTIYECTVYSIMPAAECAAAGGYADAEEFVLMEYCGVSAFNLPALSKEERQVLIRDAVLNSSWSGSYLRGIAYQEMGYTEESLSAAIGDGTFDLDRVLFQYRWSFTPRLANEFYQTCILPDISANTLGRVWVTDSEDYRATVCGTDIEFGLMRSAGGDTYEDHDYFSTHATVDSARTNAWLAGHGVKQYTLAELYAMSDWG